jgi:hypothetical protein
MENKFGGDANWRIGGISFISRRFGWGADNVRNFEVSGSFHFGTVLSE